MASTSAHNNNNNTTTSANITDEASQPVTIPTIAYTSTAPARAPELGERPIYQSNTEQHRSQNRDQKDQQASVPHILYTQARRPSTQQTNYTTQPGAVRGRQYEQLPPSSPTDNSATGPRRTSFGFLRRSSSQQPASRQPTAGHQPQPSNGSLYSSSTGSIFRTRSRDGKSERKMLRKSSKIKAQQQAELERQRAAAANRQAPRLPQHAPLPGIATFGGEDARPDSVAMFNHAYTDSNSPPAIPTNAATNFSRPPVSSSGYNNSSSSPDYALRGADRSSPPSAAGNGEPFDPTGQRLSSITNRGRYSYASSTAPTGNMSSPRRVRRRRDPTPFNVLVIGAKNAGKTSFISFLRNSLALRHDKYSVPMEAPATTTTNNNIFTSQYLETEIDGERIGLTLWDSAGLEKNIVDLQLREMTAFIEAKFEETFTEEQKVMRSPGFKDTHIHCVFLVLDPIRLDANILAAPKSGRIPSGLDEDLDLQVLGALWAKTTVIPVIAKSDTLTTSHMSFLKRAVWESIKSAKLNPLDALELEDDDDLDELDEDGFDEDGIDDYGEENGAPVKITKRSAHARQASLSSSTTDEDPYIPMSVFSPDPYSLPPYTKYAPKSQSEIGRRYPWGFASPFDPSHCDFIRLRDSIFSEWRADLRELSRVKWYEQWRTSRLRNVPNSKPRAIANPSGSQAIPIRESSDKQGARNFSSGSQSIPRSVSINTHAVQPVPPAVGMAVTTPSGMGNPSYR